MARGLYLLLTPVDPSVLRKVNCLLLGAISLPFFVLTAQVRGRKDTYILVRLMKWSKNMSPKLSVAVTNASCVCVSVWPWGGEAVRHCWLQLRSDRGREAASLQGPDETQSTRDVKTFSTEASRHRLFPSGLGSDAEPACAGLVIGQNRAGVRTLFSSSRISRVWRSRGGIGLFGTSRQPDAGKEESHGRWSHTL